MLFIYLLIIVVALLINYFITCKFCDIASDKGHDGSKYFWWCFLLGTVGYIMVAALPDLNLYQYPDATQNHYTQAYTSSTRPSDPADWSTPPPAGKWRCTCGRINANYVSSCSCGVNKRDITK